MLQLQNLLFKRGNRVLFDHVDVSIHQNQKVGIVGRNGCGKSTLFELIRSRILPEEGEVFLPNKWSISHLEQSVSPSSRNALDFVVDGDQKLRAIEKQIRHIDVEKNPEKDEPRPTPEWAGAKNKKKKGTRKRETEKEKEKEREHES